MEKRTSPVVCLALAASLWILATGRAQDIFVTNMAQLCQLSYSGSYSMYMADTPWCWRGFSFGVPLWLDCTESNLPCAALFPGNTNIQYNGVSVNVAEAVLVRDVITGITTISAPGSTDIIAQVAAPAGWYPGLWPEDRGVVCLFEQWTNSVDSFESWGEPDGGIIDPVVTLTVLLANAADYDTYSSNVAAECEAAAAPSAVSFAARFTPMDDDGGGDGDGDPPAPDGTGIEPVPSADDPPFNLLQPFAVTSVQPTSKGIRLTWQSAQWSRYLVFYASTLNVNTTWMPQAYVWGATNSNGTNTGLTSYIDTTSTNMSHRFYKVQRLLGSPISAGGNHSLAVTPDQKVWAWGSNADGQLSDGFSGDVNDVESLRPYPGEVADPTVCTGQFITNAVAVAGGGNEFTMVVDANGTVWAAGENGAGEQGGAPGFYYNSDHFPATPISGVSNVVNVAGGMLHVLALRADAKVSAWGSDSDPNSDLIGQLGIGGLNTYTHWTSSPTQTLLSVPVVAIAAGAYHSVALDATGLVWVWGRGWEGQLANGLSGYLVDTNVPIVVAGISNVIAVAAGAYHTLALTADKTVWSWGTITSGALGRTGDNTVPGLVTNLTNVVAITAGYNFSLAVTGDGRLFGWGDGGYGELGVWGIGSTNSPVQVYGISNVVLVSATSADPNDPDHDAGAERHVMAMTLDPLDGTGQMTNHYWGWGDNTDGAVGNGTNQNNSGGGQNNYQYTPAQVQFCTRCQRCVQLGTGEVFTAQCNGTLYLYFNDDQTAFGDNGGTFSAQIGGYPAVTVDAQNPYGVAAAIVTNGGVYHYTAGGTCYSCNVNTNSCWSDADGNGNPSACSSIDITNAVCPTARCFSLVGKIQ